MIGESTIFRVIIIYFIGFLFGILLGQKLIFPKDGLWAYLLCGILWPVSFIVSIPIVLGLMTPIK